MAWRERRESRWQLMLAVALLLASAGLYLLHFLIFGDLHHIGIYLLGDLAFLPIQVLLVTLIINRLLVMREKKTKLDKLNMVIGSFFSEVGNSLIRMVAGFDRSRGQLQEILCVEAAWSRRDYSRARAELDAYRFEVDSRQGDLAAVKTFLAGERNFLLGLLGNPNLLEHDTFTELLWAVFHLTEELQFRPAFDQLPAADLDHLASDMKRAYRLLLQGWLDYLQHLQGKYPYLFSLAIRINPLNPRAAVVIGGQVS